VGGGTTQGKTNFQELLPTYAPNIFGKGTRWKGLEEAAEVLKSFTTREGPKARKNQAVLRQKKGGMIKVITTTPTKVSRYSSKMFSFGKKEVKDHENGEGEREPAKKKSW